MWMHEFEESTNVYATQVIYKWIHVWITGGCSTEGSVHAGCRRGHGDRRAGVVWHSEFDVQERFAHLPGFTVKYI